MQSAVVRLTPDERNVHAAAAGALGLRFLHARSDSFRKIAAWQAGVENQANGIFPPLAGSAPRPRSAAGKNYREEGVKT
jgi:hypothetical protein